MTALPPERTDPTTQVHPPEPSIGDEDWVRSVVSAALLQANIPSPQAERVLHAATAEPADPAAGPTGGPFSIPPKPRSGDLPDLEAAPRVDETTARLEAARVQAQTSVAESGKVAEFAPNTEPPEVKGYVTPAPIADSSVVTLPRTVAPPLSTTLPPLDAPVDSDISNIRVDHVLEESDASVEGYRQSDVRTVVEWLVVVFLALVVAVLAKEFVVQAFWIPSESMETTVNVGDRVLVNKLSYQFNDVRRGDLVVFSKVEGTQSDTEDLIKRAIALPGETLELRSDGRLWIWGPGETPDDALLLDEPYLDVQNELLNPPSPTDAPSSTIWHENCVNDGSNLARCTLDNNSFFMMGDNRSRSLDSRGFGPVPEENLIGRAFFRIWPLGAVSTL